MKKIIIVLSIMCMQIYAAQRMPVKVLPTNNVSNAPKFTRPKSYSDPNLRSARSPQDRELMKQLSEEAARKGAERSGTTFQRSGSMASQKRGSISVVNPLKSYVSGLQNKIDTIHTVAKSRGRSAKVQGLSKTIGDILQEEGAIQEGQVTQATKAKIEATLGKASQIADPSKLKRFTRSIKKTFGYKGANKDIRNQLAGSKGVISDNKIQIKKPENKTVLDDETISDDLNNLSEQKASESIKSLNDKITQSLEEYDATELKHNMQTPQVTKVRKKGRLQFKKQDAPSMPGLSGIKNNDVMSENVDTSVQDSMPELSNDDASSPALPVYGPQPKPVPMPRPESLPRQPFKSSNIDDVPSVPEDGREIPSYNIPPAPSLPPGGIPAVQLSGSSPATQQLRVKKSTVGKPSSQNEQPSFMNELSSVLKNRKIE